ncbi:hypothetical protein NNC19_04985 [Clostridium sp. SHJSY1]|uniref:hypothetical protein n=1 Tax=Clostridium sp. SHJSY1 TaxID=2942483 RepID=UPI0028753EE4|nr:hypothetical protein [Clostridium sp. SHJSY1]MDS0525027.1 hypothetical protein [Clostridium sp. SHJSY1]
MSNSKGILTIVLGIASCIIFFVAGIDLGNTGDKMQQLKSQSGTTVAEAYYQDIGSMNKGLGKLCYGLGIASLAISIGLSKNNVSEDIKKSKSVE